RFSRDWSSDVCSSDLRWALMVRLARHGGRGGAMDDGLHLWVYILRCADHSYYVDSTRKDHPAEREWEHNQGVVAGYTRSRRPVTDRKSVVEGRSGAGG